MTGNTRRPTSLRSDLRLRRQWIRSYCLGFTNRHAVRLVFAVPGLPATLGDLIYELSNSQLHDDLISRGRKDRRRIAALPSAFLAFAAIAITARFISAGA